MICVSPLRLAALHSILCLFTQCFFVYFDLCAALFVSGRDIFVCVRIGLSAGVCAFQCVCVCSFHRWESANKQSL